MREPCFKSLEHVFEMVNRFANTTPTWVLQNRIN